MCTELWGLTARLFGSLAEALYVCCCTD
jgi:hypothetical protein